MRLTSHTATMLAYHNFQHSTYLATPLLVETALLFRTRSQHGAYVCPLAVIGMKKSRNIE